MELTGLHALLEGNTVTTDHQVLEQVAELPIATLASYIDGVNSRTPRPSPRLMHRVEIGCGSGNGIVGPVAGGKSKM